jgi:hypothetical protein
MVDDTKIDVGSRRYIFWEIDFKYRKNNILDYG